MAKAKLKIKKTGYLVQVKLRGKWQPMMNWKESIMGWTPAVSKKKTTAVRLQKKLQRLGVGVGLETKEGKQQVKKKIVPVRVIPVSYIITGKMGSRTFDFKRIRKR